MFSIFRYYVKKVIRFLGFNDSLIKFKIIRLKSIRSKEILEAKKRILNSRKFEKNETIIFEEVSTKVHLGDDMYVKGMAEHYLLVGMSAIRCINLALSKSGKKFEDVKYILDFPSGYGRVLRFIKAQFPKSIIYAAEVEKNALLFCEKEFKIKPILSSSEFKNINIPVLFDLIWCGSLITHLNEDQTNQLLIFFSSKLNKNGNLVLTSHGQKSFNRLKSGKVSYGLSEKSNQLLLRGFEKRGFGFSNYEGSLDYGISICSFEKMKSLLNSFPDLEITLFEEAYWDDHQDLYCLRKRI